MGFRLDDVIQLEVTEIASIPSLFYPMSFKSSLGSVPPYQDDASYQGPPATTETCSMPGNTT